MQNNSKNEKEKVKGKDIDTVADDKLHPEGWKMQVGAKDLVHPDGGKEEIDNKTLPEGKII